MPAQCPLTSSLTFLVLLGTASAGPFPPRSNVTLPAPRPPPQPGGGSPSSQLYEHTMEGGEKQVVFTHRINLPPSAGCGCPPGTEPPVPASEMQALRIRLEILEELVKGLKEQCTGGCCPAAAQAGTGQTDVRSLCSLHGVFDLSRCACSCEPGWGGPTCSDPTESGMSPSSPPAESGSCPDDCNDQGRCIRGRCVCFPGYTGPSCGWPSCPGDCQGRGRCVQGVCVCRAGFSGPDCGQRSCPRSCSQRGRCEDGRCVCDPGYTGEDCGVKSCPRSCSQRGRCENGRCVCNPGYSGEDCGVKSCPRGCSQRGRCEAGRCVCDPGYTGEDCGVRSCPWDCGEGGRCVDGRCVCWPGYAGEDCSTRTCPRNCRGRGRCEDGECICDAGYSGDDCGVRSCPGDCNQRGRCEDGRCVCWPGYTGPDCSARACPRDCRGRGRCENGVCVCNTGYSGEDCGVRSCPGDCRGRGRCESGRCVCWPGYTGRDCGTRACPGDCRGRGRCVDGRCVCNPGFTGEDCGSRRCPGDCRGHGRCEDGVCVCHAGYSGEDCSTRSCPGGCRGRGQCLDGRCVCDDGYSGEDCGVRRCPRDCSQHGVCQDGVCTCWEGYAGEDCSIRTCSSNCHGRGRCEDGRCVCDPGYTGPVCATRTCPADCRGRGRCVQGVCICHTGYGGEDCGQEEPPASACPGGCGPRELCRAGQCVCVEGFRGPDCAIQICPRDCHGRGECRQGSCFCQDGYAGEDCGEEVPAIENMRMHLLEETTVRTEWTRVPGSVDAYEIQFIPTTEGASPPFTARVPSSASAYDQRGLAPGQEYQVTVRALRGTSWGPPASKTITTMIDGPQDLRVVAVTPTTLELSWLRPQAEVDRFVVSYVSAGNQRVRLEVPPEADGTLLTDLMPGVEYVVTVTAERGRAVSYPASVRANTGSSPSGLLGATDEPPPSGPSTTQGAEAPLLQQRPQELGELRVLGRDKTGRLRVTWTAQPDTFAHFQLRLQVPEGPGAHEELLPGDVRQALMPPPPPGAPYKLLLHGIPPGGKPSVPITYQGVMDRDGEKPRKSLSPPRLGELTVTDVTSDSLLLRWTVPEGEFDSFVIQYKDRDGPQVMPVEGPQRLAPITSLEPGRKYKFVLYGLVNKKRHGPLVAEAKILPQSDPSPETPPRLGKLWVTDPTPDSLHLSWTVPEGQFDSFIVQYKDKDGRPQVVPVEGPERSVIISPLDSDHKYRFTLFGIADKKRYGPLMADGTTAPERQEEPPRPESLEQPLLGELTVTGVTPDSLRLSWTVAQGPFDSFVVQYKDVQGQPQAVPVRGDENEVTVPGLESNRKYKMNLYGLHGRHRVGPVSVVAKTAPQEVVDEIPSPTKPNMEVLETPEQPRLGELTVTDSTPDSLSLSWTVPEGQFDHFLVQYKNGDGQFKVVRVPGYEDEVTISGLEPDHKYKMHLYGFHSGQRVGPMSATGVTTAVEETPSSIEVETPSPTEPSTEAPEPTEEPLLGELMVTGTSPDSLSLSWTVPQGQFDSFTIQYKDRDGQPQVVRVGGEERETTVGDLEPGRKYKMHLYGLHQGHRVGPMSTLGMTDPFPTTQATETPDRPLEPWLGELTVTDVTPDSVGLLWTVPEGEFDSFMIQYKDRHGQPQVVPVTADQREVTIPGLEPSRKYKFLLFGIQDGKRRSPVSVEAKTAARSDASPGALPRLGELWVTDTTPESLRLSWTVPEGHFDSFVVQYKSKDGPQVVPVEGHERSATITSLDPGRKYRFLLYGLLGKKRFGPLTADATTVSPSSVDHTGIKPQLGEELQVTGVTSDSVGLSWTVPEGQFDSFVVQYKDRDGQPQVVPVDGSLREVNVSGLDPDRRYKLLLYGLHNSKRVGPLSAIAMTAPREKIEGDIPTPSPPTAEPHLGELMVEEATPHSLHLSWMVINGEFDSFEVQYEDRDGQLQVVSTGGDQSDITLTGLESNHRYLVTLYGFHDGQRVDSTHIEALTVPQEEENEPSEVPTMTPEPPLRPHLGELTVTDATPDSLSLSWTIPEGQFDHFLVQYKNGDGQPKVMRVPGHEDEVTISGLEPDHKYKMHLYGFHSAPDSLSLSWTVPQGHFDSFTIQYKDRDGRPQVVRVGGKEREATVRDLEPGRKYKMHLYGLHQGHRMGPVSTLGVTAPEEEPSDAPPLKPRLEELTVTDATSDTLSLYWTVPEGQFDHFLLQYKNGDGQPKAVRVPGHKDSITISGLEPDHKYKMHLYGFHGNQRMGPVSAIGSTDPEKDEILTATLTEPPTTTPEPSIKPRLGELTVTEATPDSLSLSWTIPEGQFDHFLVQYKNGDGQPKVVRVPGHEDKVTISGLEPDHKYKMHLYGFHSGQRTGPISVIGVTTAEEETPSPTEVEETPRPTEPSTDAPEPTEEPLPGELTVTGSSPDSLSLSWTVPQGQFDSFTIQYKGRDGRPQVVRVGGEEREATVGDLEPGRKYKMHLYGLHQGRRVGPVSTLGMTAPRKVVEETPSPTEPSMEAPEPTEEPLLGELTVTGSSPDSLSLSWIVTQGHFDSFTIQYKDRDGRPQVVHVGGEEREATVEDLEPGHKYKMHLYGLHQGHRVGPMSTVGMTASPDSLSLSWTVPQGQFDSFTIQYKDRDGRPQVVRVGGEEREATVGDLEPGRKYKMHLYGLHQGHRVGPMSTVGVTGEFVFIRLGLEPDILYSYQESTEEPLLGELTVTGASPDSLSLSWTVPQGHFDSFTIQYKDRDGQPQVVRVGGEEREATVGDLEPGRKYKMHLYGLHQGHRVGPASAVGVTSSLPTQTPVEPHLGDLAVAAVTLDTVHLSWTVAQGPFDSFLVQYKDAQGQLQAVPVNRDLREVTVSGLDPARKYRFLLFGLLDGKRHGPVSVDAKTLPDKKPSPRLGELTVTDVTPDSMGLSWTVPEGEFDSFVIQYKDRDGQPQVVPVAADQRKVTIPSLEPNRKYKFLLYGLAGRKRLGPLSADGTTAALEKTQQPPPRLGELAVTEETSDSLRLSWTVAQGPFDSFLVQYKDTNGQSQAVPVAADQLEVTIEGLKPGRKYKFLLYGLVGGKRVGPVSILGMTAPEEDTPAPEAPEPSEAPNLGVLAVTEATPDSLRLSWSVVQGPFDSFVVQYLDTDGQPQALLVDGDQNKVLISGLEPNTSYQFSLYGLHEGMRRGPISTEGTTGPPPAGLTPGDPGPRLSHLSVTDVTTSSLRLNWEAPLGAFDSFLLRFGVPSPSTLEPRPRPLLQRELMVPGTRRSAVLRDLRPGTLYSLTLYGLRGPHKADSIQGTARTLSPILESPRDLQFSEIGETSAMVSWVPPPSRVDSFKVSYQLADGGEPQSVQVDGRAQTQKIQGLIPGARYEVTVVSVRGFEESEPLTGFLTTVPDGPTELRALNLTEGSTLLHWKPPQNPVDKYNVQVTAPGAPSLQDSAPGSAVDYPLRDLVLHTNYTATVRGLRGPNFTSPASITFTTGLKAPLDLETKEVTPRTALLTWTEPQVLPTGYLLSFDTPGGQTQEILLPSGITSHRLLGLFPSTYYNARLQAVWGQSLTPPVSTSFTTGGLQIPFPRDCGEEMQNGPSTSRTTTIFLNGNRERPLNVFCDMETDGGGWLVFQRRMDGQTDFWRDWEDYAHGFGNISREFWLGNEALHSLTQAGDYSMRVDLRAGDEAVFAQYDSFRVGSAAENYRLHLEGYHGTAGDSMSYHSGSVFSARDRDPNNLLISCAVSYRGAWWYRNCHYANLNGLYGSTVDHQGVSWYHWKGFEFSVPFTEMKLRPRSYRSPVGGG
ncbi:tenascin XB [Ictidomys tridecemlineatus]|nr:tenascin XB [Ictidomys tridecemlineatus]